jgi:hypothetical protein
VSLWKLGTVVAPGHCKGCSRGFYKGERVYLSPKKKVYCTSCAVDRNATVEKSPQVQAKLDRVTSRFFDFVAGEIEKKLKR